MHPAADKASKKRQNKTNRSFRFSFLFGLAGPGKGTPCLSVQFPAAF
jgi:hypothetical protein